MHPSSLPWPALLLAGLTLLSTGPRPQGPGQEPEGKSQQPAGKGKKGEGKGKKAQGKPNPPPAEADETEPALEKKKVWDPQFDYTNLPPSNETFWAPLGAAKVTMEAAWELVQKGEEKTLFPIKAELKPSPEGDYWAFEVFAQDKAAAEGTKPTRINLRVSAAEPKVIHRLPLLSMAPDEEALWPPLLTTRTELPVAVQVAREHTIGNKPEPLLSDPRVRTLRFVPGGKTPYWRIELLGVETKSQLIRRFDVEVSAKEPRMRRNLMMDRFAGEPLRKDQPIELPNGMFVFDLTMGDGQEITADSKVRVNYRLFLLDNTKLHDTWQTKLPEDFVVSEAPLKGMSEGMVGMRVGGKRKIAMPYTLGFGEKGNELAPPKAMVVCDISVDGLIGP